MAESSLGTQKLHSKVAASQYAYNAYIGLDKGDMDAFDDATNALDDEATELGLSRIEANRSLVTTTVADDTIMLTVAFTAGEAATITGAGVFSASEDGDLWAWHRWAGQATFNPGDIINQTFFLQITGS